MKKSKFSQLFVIIRSSYVKSHNSHNLQPCCFTKPKSNVYYQCSGNIMHEFCQTENCLRNTILSTSLKLTWSVISDEWDAMSVYLYYKFYTSKSLYCLRRFETGSLYKRGSILTCDVISGMYPKISTKVSMHFCRWSWSCTSCECFVFLLYKS